MAEVNFKPGQKVNATNNKGATVAGKVVGVKQGQKGAFVEVDHGEAGTKSYRPSKVAPA